MAKRKAYEVACDPRSTGYLVVGPTGGIAARSIGVLSADMWRDALNAAHELAVKLERARARKAAMRWLNKGAAKARGRKRAGGQRP